nr:MAG TPA: hypothetical protein [Caudoviricetes sp.]
MVSSLKFAAISYPFNPKNLIFLITNLCGLSRLNNLNSHTAYPF